MFGPVSSPLLVWVVIAFGVFGTAVRIVGEGRITVWGRNDAGQATVPAGISNFVAIEAGYNHSLAIQEDGRVIAWGGDWEGITNVPPNLTNAVTIAAGSVHNLAVLRSGSVRVWGDLTHNQSSIPIDLTNAVDCAATMAGGYPYSVALRTDGTVAAWGQFQEMWRTNYLSGLTDVVAIGVGDGDGVILALKSNGTIQGWDLSSYGPLSIPDGLSNIVEIALGWRHCLALRSDGTVVGWGDNSQGQITIPTDLTNVVAISAGVLFSVALKADGSVVAWGYNEDSRATVPGGLSNVVAISAGGNHCMAMSWDGPLKAWQTSPPDLITYSGQRVMLRCAAVGFPVPSFQWRLHGTNLPGATRPYLFVEQAKVADSLAYSVMVTNVAGDFVDLPILANVVDQPPFAVISPVSLQTNITKSVTFSVEAKGSLPMAFQWFHNGVAIAGATSPSFVRSNLNLSHAGEYSVVLSNAFGVVESSPATLEVGQLIGWENSDSGSGGYFRALRGDLADLVSIEAGDRHSIAMTRSGRLIGLGDPYWNQSAIPTGEPYTRIVAVAEAQDNVLALRDDGTVVIWGNQNSTNVPAGLNEVVAIAAGRYHYLALRKNGTVVGWNFQAPPFQVPQGLSNVIAVSAWANNSLALKQDGSVVGWGTTATQYGTPVLTNAIAIASGGTHGLALLQTGRLIAWGGAAPAATNVPPSIGQIAAISAGTWHSTALRTDGTVVTWGGYNGISTNAVPNGLTNVIGISAGNEYTLAMAGAAQLSFWKQPEAAKTIVVGHTNVLFGAAVGMPPIHYQWRRDGTNIPGANSSFLFLEDLNLAGDVRTYTLVASNAFGTLVSSQALVEVVDSPPFIVRHPTSVNTNLGRTVVFSVESDGSWPISYQWRLNGVPVPGATNSTLTLSNVSFAHEGTYSVTASNAFGTLSSDGAELLLARVVAWGRNTAGETNPPPSLTNVLAISAGYYYGVALRGDGSISRWGARSNAPVGLTNVIQVDAGGYSSIALQADGRVRVWDDGPIVAHLTNFANGLSDVAAVAAGEAHFAALMGDGRVLVWAVQGGVTNVPFNATNVVSISAAANYCLALRDNGTVIGWGSGPINVPLGLTNVVAIEAGATTAVAVRKDGSVTAWNLSGLVALPPAVTNVSGVAVGSTYGLGLKYEGVIVPWGSASSGQTNFPRNLSNYVAVATERDFGLGLVSTGPPTLWHYSVLRSNLFSGEPIFLRARAAGSPPLSFQWQFNGTNIIGATNANLAIMNPSATNAGLYRVIVSNDLGSVDSEDIPVNVTESAPIVTSQPVSVETNLFANARLSVGAIGSKPLTYQWLSNGIPIPGATGPAITISNLQVGQSGVFNVRLSNSFGEVQSAAAAINVRPVIAWGYGNDGRTNIVSGVTNVAGVAAGVSASTILRRNGTVQQWSPNVGIVAFAQSLSNISAISVKGPQSMALSSNGTVTVWGFVTNVPVNLDGVVGIASGAYHCAALRSNGTIVAWGANSNQGGQTNVPTSLIDAIEIASGNYHGLAIRDDGSVRGWGVNSYGQAEAPPNLSNVVAIAAGSQHSLALRDDGRVFVWGANHAGQTNMPFAMSNVVAIAAGDDHSMVLFRNGTVSEWGGARYAAPRSLTNIVAIASGDNHFLALVGEGTPFVRRLFSPRTAVCSGQRIRLSVDAVGQWPLTFQWRFNGVDISGATNIHFWITNVQVANSGVYAVSVRNALGSVLVETPFMDVADRPPEIRMQPVSQATNITGAADFEVVCNGSEPLRYQWFHNGNVVPGGTSSRLQLQGLNMRQAGEYSVTVSNAFGVEVSSNATLSVSPLVAWGCSDICPPQVPIDGFDVVALAAGDGHALALRSDGTVVAWGKNDLGQADVPSDLTSVVQIAASGALSVALCADGKVRTWGISSNVPPDVRNIVNISGGLVALKGSGEVVSWAPYGNRVREWSLGFRDIVSVASGLALRRNGQIVAWDPMTGERLEVPAEVRDAILLSSTDQTIVRSDGAIVQWGSNWALNRFSVDVLNGEFISYGSGNGFYLGLKRDGMLDARGTTFPTNLPAGLLDVVAVASGGYQGLALAGAGLPKVRALPFGGSTAYSGEKLLLRVEAVGEFPIRYQWLLNGVPIAGATNAAFFHPAPDEPGSAVYGVEVSNVLGTTNVSVASFSVVDSPPLIVALPNTVGGNVFSNAQFSVVAGGSGPVSYQWYFEGEAISGATNSVLSLTNLWPTQTGLYQVLVSNRFGVVVSQPAELRVTPVVAWGLNAYGQTIVPAGLHQIVAISAGAQHMLALNSDGTITRWGDAFSGLTNIPPEAKSLVNIAASKIFEIGGSQSLGLRQDGNVIQWDFHGGSTTQTVYHVDASQISSGYGFRVALKTDGTVIAWDGVNTAGQTDVPTGMSNVVSVSAGYDHAMALLGDGRVRAWGNTNYGLAETANLISVKAIAAGGSHSLALLSNGTVVAWGWNGYGQTNVPNGLSNIVAIAAGSALSMALRENGTVVVWGENQFGASDVPLNLSNVVAITVGQQYCAALIGSPIHRRLWDSSFDRGLFSSKFPAFSGYRFVLEATDSLSDTNWAVVASRFGQGGIATLSVTNAVTGQRFYRLRRE